MTTLVISQPLVEQLLSAAQEDRESAAVLLVRLVPTPDGDTRLLAHDLRWVPGQYYERREHDSLSIASNGYVPALAYAAEHGLAAIFVHTHPGEGASPTPSTHDALVDNELIETFRIRTGQSLYGSLVVSPLAGGLRFTGRILLDEEEAPLDRMWTVGDRLRMISAADGADAQLPDQFSRNIKAFGGDIQQVLSNLRISLVGCGGTGSAVAEQLVRLGVRHLSVFDPDELSESNLTRLYGSTPAQIGRAKVDVVSDHLEAIAPDVVVERIRASITSQEVALRLTGADVVFGCTDDNAGRLVLSRLATFLMVPIIDCGVLLSSGEQGRLTGIDGRVSVMVPGAACLVCRNRIDMQRASAESMTVEERQGLAEEGYAPALGQIEPAVVTFTTMVASAAVNELLERLIHYGPEPVPSELLLRWHEREISTNIALPREKHYCHPQSGRVGRGITQPFLEQTWAA